MRFLVEYRVVLSLALSTITGVIGPHTWPFPAENVFLALIQVRQPTFGASLSNVKAHWRKWRGPVRRASPESRREEEGPRVGDDVSKENPILDSRLPDGSRVAAIVPPCGVGHITLTIPKFQTRCFTADELVQIGTMTPEVLAHVPDAIHRNENILISGGTRTGKTTLRKDMSAYLPATDRVVLK